MTAAQIKLIHVGCRTLGLDQDTRHDLQLVATGKASLTMMSEAELEKVLAALKSKGFTPSAGHGAGDCAKSGGRKPKRQAAARGDVRFCHVLWGKLVLAGAVNLAGAKGLNAFIRVRYAAAWGAVPLDVDQMQDWRQIATVIEALKAMCARTGIDLK